METSFIENTKSRDIHFDAKLFENQTNKFNSQCFFEQDAQGNKNYFSINELLNDLETFGVESWYPKLNESNLGTDFGNAQKFIKLALLKNILAKYRDYQEIIMHGFVDYEKQKKEEWYANKAGLLAEKVVERIFRNFANNDNRYAIKVQKASIGEDQNDKVDLIIHIKDKHTGVDIKKELQLTLNHNEEILKQKRIQISRQKEIRKTDLSLLELELHLLDQKVTLWRNLKRPVGWLNELLSIEDKEFLKETYSRIVSELIEKQKKPV